MSRLQGADLMLSVAQHVTSALVQEGVKETQGLTYFVGFFSLQLHSERVQVHPWSPVRQLLLPVRRRLRLQRPLGRARLP